ncbi:2,3-bisphosphoglycerate-dependent phosphoglycerate mutase [Klebsormidium nitens]|uniref:phosphoglycerate mutase (2,3-diphosphoglycerate-dependent) n=1 Tax=Klebsormidium nitens TaxID=105231 RepID=A0A1Y1HQS0_KLENI|nr:2,3-bisphosphoglycerate-dependent phosphoglycerate mutase [Klebsormidium nitens]|eukprot:GAQ80984.1 2,3-bisphosphoglycerate-dependent phosphoglycerate mutase [Klebsormidium nitens]
MEMPGGQPYDSLHNEAELSKISHDAAFMEEGKNGKGEVYFIRHGESESNRQGRFAGVFDVALTPFGQNQARRAGLDIKAKKLAHFDKVYVSYMLRARQTCKLALEEAGIKGTEPEQDGRIAERSFGTFAGRSIALLRQAFGYEPFEHFMHSAYEAPPQGETMKKVYERARLFMEDKVLPRVERGEKVLVVSHQYVIEPLAFYLDGLTAGDFFHFNLPNGKALSRSDLVKYKNMETGGFGKFIQKLGDMVALHGLNLSPLLFIVGLLLRWYFTDAMPKPLFQTFLTVALFFSTLYSYLEIDLPISFARAPLSAAFIYFAQFVARVIVMVPLLLTPFKRDVAGQLFALYWLVPPALTCATVSLLWGGGLYLSVVVSLIASLLQPLLLIILSATDVTVFKPEDMTFFYILLAVGLGVPGAIAQIWRRRSPVDCKKHAKKWQWLGTVAFMCLGLFSGYQFTPESLIHLVFNHTYSTAEVFIIQRCFQQFWLALAQVVGMQLLGALLAATWQKFFRGNLLTPGHNLDLYIVLATPNIFLWAALAQASDAQQASADGGSHTDYAKFWLSLFFFIVPTLTQRFLVSRFSKEMLIEAHQEEKMDREELEKMWARYDTDKSNSLTLLEMTDLVRDLQKRTTGSTHINEFVVRKLFEVMDSDGSGDVEFDEFLAYFNAYGMVVQLN